MTAKQATPMPDGKVRPKAPSAPPKKHSWLLAELHRAQHQGAKTMEVSTAELSELLAKLESAERPMGKHVGWASSDKLEAMRYGSRKYLTVALYKSDKFNEQVVSLPREVES